MGRCGYDGRWVVLMVAAAVQMLAARTTVMPREKPAHLVTRGTFRLSRNPIYLGDALILAGAVRFGDVPLALPLVFGFMVLIRRRFMAGEEAVLHTAFGAEFDDWAAQVGRWFGVGDKAVAASRN